MADVTMCSGIECPIKEKCLRYTSEPNEFRQSYFYETPLKDGICDKYLSDKINEKQTQNGNIQFCVYSERN